MERWNGGRWSSWSFRHEIGSNVSSSSGTIASALSTAYTSSGSRFSTFSMEAAMHFDSLGIHEEEEHNRDSKTWWREAADKDRRDLITSLVLEFMGAPSVTYSIQRGDMSAVERWLEGLGVGWVISLHDGAGAGASAEVELDRDARTWIRALDEITRTLCLTMPLFPDCGSAGLPGICEEEGELFSFFCELEGEPMAEKSVPDQYHLALFIQETMLKMLAFVEVLVAMDSVMLPKLFKQLVVHDTLSDASNNVLTLFDSRNSVQVQRMENKIANLLSEYKSMLGEAIRSTMEKIRTKSMEDGDDSSSAQGSSDIHKVTQSVMTYIRFLWANYSSVQAAIHGADVPCIENVRPLDSMIMEMVSCLQEKLANISESFPDQGLRFLFLLNNSNYIHQIHNLYFYSAHRQSKDIDLTHKIEGLIERYLQVSWAPLLSCLFSSKIWTPFTRHTWYFESEFETIYFTHKHWKVPDHELKRRLRKVITDKIIPGYTEFVEDNKVTKLKFSPQDLKSMLQELFEG